MPGATKTERPLPGISQANTLLNEANVKLGDIDNQIRNIEANKNARRIELDKAIGKLTAEASDATAVDEDALTDLNKARKMVAAQIEAYGPVPETALAQ